MKDKEFDELIQSIKQAGAMRRGERKASRVFKFTPLDVKKIRTKTDSSLAKFSHLIRVN